LLKHAILAPSYLNAQPWRFEARPNEIRIFGDLKRWGKVADMDQRQLYISIGCALENILIAAEHFGYGHRVSFLEGEQAAAVIELNAGGKPSSFRDAELFKAIPDRHTIHRIYEKKTLPPEDTKCLKELCIEEGFALHFTDDIEIKRKTKELIRKAYAIRLSNNTHKRDLRYWLAKDNSGKNRPISKIGQIIANCLKGRKNEAKKDSDILMSAPIFAAITSENNGHRSQIEAGQILERIWLKANILGIGLSSYELHPAGARVKRKCIEFPSCFRCLPPADLYAGICENRREARLTAATESVHNLSIHFLVKKRHEKRGMIAVWI
jgi:hypothetical protein